MSVWKKVENNVLGKNVNEKMLEAALADLGITLNKQTKTIRNTWGTDTCDAALVAKGKITSMGIRWTKNKGIELVGDTYNCNFGHGIGDKGQQALADKIAQAYQVRWVKYQMQMNNWQIEQQVDVNGKVKLVMTQA